MRKLHGGGGGVHDGGAVQFKPVAADAAAAAAALVARRPNSQGPTGAGADQYFESRKHHRVPESGYLHIPGRDVVVRNSGCSLFELLKPEHDGCREIIHRCPF